MIILYRLVLSAVLSIITLISLNFVNVTATQTPLFDSVALPVLFVFICLAAFISPLIKAHQFPLSTPAREQGNVKWFNISKGYGFVTRDSGEDVFVHFRSIRGKGRGVLYEGQRVEFTVVDGEKGPQAEDVESLSNA